MELDRHYIERNDFSAARRGYDPDEVDRHLREIADSIAELLALESPHVPTSSRRRGGRKVEGLDRGELERLVVDLEQEMYVAAEELRFEYAAKLRDEIKELRRELNALAEA